MANRIGSLGFADLRDPWRRLRRRPLEPRVFPPNWWTVEEVERRIRFEPVEWAYVFDRAGQQVFRARGNPESVVVDPVTVTDAVLIHNHPPEPETPLHDPRGPGRSFSDLDIALLLTHNLAAMVVVTPGWRFVVARPPGGWVPDAESAVAYYNETWAEVRPRFDRAVAFGRLSLAQADARTADIVVQAVADWGSFIYRGERVEP